MIRSHLAISIALVLACCASCSRPANKVTNQTIRGADDAKLSLQLTDTELVLDYHAPHFSSERCAVFLALGTHRDIGSAVLPFEQGTTGSTVFLPFKADLLISARAGKEGAQVAQREWKAWKWSAPQRGAARLQLEKDKATLRIPRAALGSAPKIDLTIYAKDMSANAGWGRMFGSIDPATFAGEGDRYVRAYYELDLSQRHGPLLTRRARNGREHNKLAIYQLFVRLFGNSNETRKPNGTLAENGVGKFNDINDAALSSLKTFGVSQIWLTGILKQASATGYPSIDQPADDPDLLKGLAGSPYAIRDYFDLCADYAVAPDKRLTEFRDLLARIHAHGMRAIIDFIPNHVARSYRSTVKPDLTFGEKGNGGKGDDRSKFFSPGNNFFYLTPDGNGPPLKLPTVRDGVAVSPTCLLPGMNCDGLYDGEREFGRVTGNNQATWTPGLNDWYETVKLNYGFEFNHTEKSVREYPSALAPDKPVPDTWEKMDAVIAYWQEIGVDGFRCDMAHMEPPEFWSWLIARARSRNPATCFIGEAYDDDPAKVPGSDPVISRLNNGNPNVMIDLLNAGFDAVYDNPTYRTLKRIYEGPAWANDLDATPVDPFVFENSLRYAENHDEARLAAPREWGGVGAKIGPAVSAVLFGLSRGPVMIYNGQEVGEPATGAEGFGGDDSRTTIFDYWSMPEFTKWSNNQKYDGARLSPAQSALRDNYSRLVNSVTHEALRAGEFYPLNKTNADNPHYGRLPGETASGHWLYSYLRYDSVSAKKLLVVVNLHPSETLQDVAIKLSEEALRAIGIAGQPGGRSVELKDLLREGSPISANAELSRSTGLPVGSLPPATARYFDLSLD